jgi:hypothetical protein
MIACFAHIYEYQGILFEIPKTGGPWPLKKDGDPKAMADKKFYDLMATFYALPKEEQERCKVGGGCITIEEASK